MTITRYGAGGAFGHGLRLRHAGRDHDLFRPGRKMRLKPVLAAFALTAVLFGG